MTVQTFDATNYSPLRVTPDAAAHFRQQLEKNHASAIRLSMKQSGCTGYKYIIEEVQSGENTDVDIVLENGVKILVDAKYLDALRGTVIDLRKQGVNLNLIMENPNVKDACGCGESVNFEEKM